MAIKILVDAHVFDGLHQGSRTYLKGLYSDFKDERFEVFFAANDINNLKKEFPGFEEKSFIKLNSKNKFIRLGIEFPRIIKKYGFDFAHFNYILPLFLNKKCKYINTLHDVLFLDFPHYFSWMYRVKNKLLFKNSARRSDILLTVSKYSKEKISAHFDIPKQKIDITPNAVNKIFNDDIDKNKSKKIVEEKFNLTKYILFVSRIEPRKNHLALVNAFLNLELYKRGYTLVFSGKKEGNQKDLENRIELLKSKDSNAFLHIYNLSEKDVVHFYNAAEICVFPSYCEGFGIPPLESASLRTPTICSNQTAMSDFDFFQEKHFNPYQNDELERAIEAALNSEEEHRKLKIIAQKIKANYSWDISRKVLIKRLLQVIFPDT